MANQSLIAGSKYGSVRQQAASAKATAPRGRVVSTSRPRLTARRSPQVFVPTAKARALCLQEWFWREIKDGGYLHQYIRREKHGMTGAVRKVGQVMQHFRQNNRSDFRLMAAIPGRLYQRWRREDEHFFEDKSNLRSLKRDNPDVSVFL